MSDEDLRPTSWVGEIARMVIAVMIGVLLSLILLLWTSDQPTHDDIGARLTRIEQNITFTNCLLLITPEDRVPERVAECQGVDPQDS